MRNVSAAIALFLFVLVAAGCQSHSYPALQRADFVDIPRFMGDWYVIACIPSYIERQEFNAIESYRLEPDGRIRTVFTYNDGGPDGPARRLTPLGFVTAGSHGTIWGMRFVWPIKADYRVMYVAPDYSQTVIGREKRDYAWIMARTPSMPDTDFRRLSTLLRVQGYDITRLRRVPQRVPHRDGTLTRG
jgi:apolipoprotein D and lipocalin family protein